MPRILSVGAPSRFVTATGCNRAPVGPCTLLTCPAGNHDTGASAGVLAITGKNIPANTALDPTMAGDYPDWVRPVGLFLAGDVITVGAAGGTLPAFTKTATAPAAITVTAPACDGKSCGSFDPTRDLTVSWSGGSDGVEVIFAVSQLSGATSYLSCRFSAGQTSA